MMCSGTRASARSQAFGERVITEGDVDRHRELVGGLRMNEETVHTVFDEFGDAAGTGGDDRNSGLHPFEEDRSELLVGRRQREDVRVREMRRNVLVPDEAGDPDAIVEVAFRDLA